MISTLGGTPVDPVPAPEPDFWTLDLTSLVQIAFWVVVGAITVASFILARRTLFQPLRTEVFKLQLARMADLLGVLTQARRESLTKHFDLDRVLEVNTIELMDEYAEVRFKLVPSDPEERPYSRKNTVGMVAKSEFLEFDDELISTEGSLAPEQEIDWASYERPRILITKKHGNAVDELEQFVSDPVLPQRAADLVDELLSAVHLSVSEMFGTLTEVGRSLPASYPDLEALKSARFGWVHNKWNRSSPDLNEPADAIVKFTRAYFQTDAIALPGARRRVSAKSNLRRARAARG